MDLELEKSEILYTGSSILAAISIVIFTAGDSVLSPVSKILILGLLSLFFLLFGTFTEGRLETLLLYGLSVFTYIAAALRGFSLFDIGTDGGFLVMAFSAAFFAGLGYLTTEKDLSISTDRLKIGIAVLVIVSLSLAAFDLAGSEVSYTVSLDEQVEIVEGESAEIGSLTVQNDFLLPRSVDMPTYEACVYKPEKTDGRISIEDEYGFDTIGGHSSEERDMTLRAPFRHDAEGDEPEELGNFTLEKADECPDSSDSQKVIVRRTE